MDGTTRLHPTLTAAKPRIRTGDSIYAGRRTRVCGAPRGAQEGQWGSALCLWRAEPGFARMNPPGCEAAWVEYATTDVLHLDRRLGDMAGFPLVRPQAVCLASRASMFTGYPVA
eukprot:363545-Chlamydomonas_euryale.AAC.15